MKRAIKVFGMILAGLVVVLALVVIWSIRTARVQTSAVFTRLQLEQARSACTSYFDFYGEWPTSLSDLTQNKSNIVFINWGEGGTSDGWGHPLVFRSFSSDSGFGSIGSYGRDGRAGGEGLNADVEIRFGMKSK